MDRDLTNDAKAVASQFFKLSEFWFDMVKVKPTAQAQKAFDELQVNGLTILVRTGKSPALTYRRVAGVDYTPYVRWAEDNADKTNFGLFVPVQNRKGV